MPSSCLNSDKIISPTLYLYLNLIPNGEGKVRDRFKFIEINSLIFTVNLFNTAFIRVSATFCAVNITHAAVNAPITCARFPSIFALISVEPMIA